MFFRVEFFDLVGDINAALLLSQIAYWYSPTKTGHSRLRVYRDGHWWIAKTHVQWYEETRLTRRQLQVAFQKLQDLGIVETLVFGFRGAPTTHIRCPLVTSNKPVDLLEVLVSGAAISGTIAPGSANHCTATCKPLHQEVQSNTETTTEKTTDVNSVPEHAGEQDMNADDILKAHNLKKELKKKELLTGVKQNGPAVLHLLWKKAIAENDTGYIKDLTAKELGQLKHLSKALEDRTAQVLSWAVENWLKFAQRAALVKGLANYPTVPNIGFLLAHHDVAVNLMWPKAVPSQSIAAVHHPMDPAAVDAVPVIHEPIDKPANDTEDPASADEIAATLAALEALKVKS